MTEQKRKASRQTPIWNNDHVYDSLTEILSSLEPIEAPEEAFNCASVLNDVTHFVKNAMSSMELGAKDISAISEILGALEVITQKIMDWEKRVLGFGATHDMKIKFITAGLEPGDGLLGSRAASPRLLGHTSPWSPDIRKYSEHLWVSV
jgi:hypothetical protein